MCVVSIPVFMYSTHEVNEVSGTRKERISKTTRQLNYYTPLEVGEGERDIEEAGHLH